MKINAFPSFVCPPVVFSPLISYNINYVWWRSLHLIHSWLALRCIPCEKELVYSIFMYFCRQAWEETHFTRGADLTEGKIIRQHKRHWVRSAIIVMDWSKYICALVNKSPGHETSHIISYPYFCLYLIDTLMDILFLPTNHAHIHI